MSHRVEWDSIHWESPMAGVRHKVVRAGDRVLRLVEYAREMVPHRCERGHVGHIINGELVIEFATGPERFRAGDAVLIPPGEDHAHRAVVISPVATALFVEDA